MENKHSSNSIESDWNSFKNAISESMNRNIPKKTVKSKADTPYKYINNLLEPENDSSSKSFWKYIKSRKQESVSI